MTALALTPEDQFYLGFVAYMAAIVVLMAVALALGPAAIQCLAWYDRRRNQQPFTPETEAAIGDALEVASGTPIHDQWGRG